MFIFLNVKQAINSCKLLTTYLVFALLLLATACKDDVFEPLPLPNYGTLQTDPGSPQSGTTLTAGTTDTLPTVAGPGDKGELRCHKTSYNARQIQELSNMIATDGTTGIIFPGAIIQGGAFEAGNFTPVTIPKAGGPLTLNGLSGGEEITVIADVYDYDEVSQKINGMLNNVSKEVNATVANFSYVLEEAYSKEEFQFNLGFDARYGLTQVTGEFSLDKEIEGSRVMLKFDQVFYTISINDPETQYSLFADGENARDPEHQMGEGNPPLYVKSASYGRQIYFIVESKYGTEEVKASLDAAYKGLGGSVEVSAGLTASKILDESSITYIVRGGGSAIALEEAPGFNAVQRVIREGASWSLSNPGILLAYELRYLATRQPARIAMVTDFVRKTCRLDQPAAYRITPVYIDCIDCRELDPFDDDKREFSGNARITTSRNPEPQILPVSIFGVPPGDKKSYDENPELRGDIELEDPRASDYIRINMNLIELDDPPNADDDFGDITHTLKLDNLLEVNASTTLDFHFWDMVGKGANEQQAIVQLRITRIR
ncbi:thiol-activated cytolysin family protein [Flavilitoribacter nigricans]|nr:thiol-activated cytolysin family protein [Flavilitoribacter nigricans]